jgi:putative ABC transport system permease protein
MNPGPVARAARGGLTRRRVQTVVIGVVLLVSTAASVLALALLVDSNAPFDHAFAAQRGADVTAAVDAARASSARLAATGRLAGVIAANGPFPQVTATVEVPGSFAGSGPGPRGQGLTLPPLTLVGRTSPGGPVDQVVLQSGHWPSRPGQVVLDESVIGPGWPNLAGARVTVTSAPGKPKLTVVGLAASVTGSAGGWVAPAEVSRLLPPGTPASAQMLYRFASAGSAAAIRADVAAVTAALPAGAVIATQSYLTVRIQQTSGIAPWVPFVVAFGVIGLVMSVLIVTNVVSGAVAAGYRRIGVLKSIGFTPGQVVAAYTWQVGVPAVTGCLAGVALGNLLAVPLLGQAAAVYQVGALHVPGWVDAALPALMCAVVGLAAVIPAMRAGRLSAVQAIAIGRAPRAGRGYAAHRLLGRLPLPRPVTIGLAAPFARPARTAITLIAVGLGATAVTFAVGLTRSLDQVAYGLSHSNTEPVRVLLPGAGPGGQGPVQGPTPGPAGGPTPGTAAGLPSAARAERAVVAALRSQPGTLHYVAQADQPVSVVALGSQQAMVTAYRGSASWIGYGMVSGHWYAGPGQVDAATGFLTATGATVGDTITMTLNGRPVTVRIVGQVFDNDNNGLDLLTGWQTLASADHGLTADQYDVGLRPGTPVMAYANELSSRLGPGYGMGIDTGGKFVPVLLGLIGMLTLLLAIVAGLGVLNTVVLHTRERVHDLGVFKAIGMTPRQAIAMVTCWVAGTGLVAGLIAVPAGMALHQYVLPAMAAAAGLVLPGSYLHVYGGGEIALLALAGMVIAVAGALLPAGWAAGTRTASALHAE